MTEEQPYTVFGKVDDIELRTYPPAVLAQVEVSGQADSAGTRAFQRLVSYIGGRNRKHPGSGDNEVVSEKMAMTAPVLQEQTPDPKVWAVSFVLPAGRDLFDYPLPTDKTVHLVNMDEHEAAALRWAGRWTYKTVQEKTKRLLETVEKQGWQPAGQVRWARYDPPWQLPFLRRNEVIVPIQHVQENAT